MNWIQSLYETYEACINNSAVPDSQKIYPVDWSTRKADIEITLNDKGDFVRADLLKNVEKGKLDLGQEVFIPITEESDSRTSTKVSPHPLCETLQYIAADYPQFAPRSDANSKGQLPRSNFDAYAELLGRWANSEHFSHPKVKSIYSYILKKNVIADLVKSGLHIAEDDITFDSTSLKKGLKSIFITWAVLEPGQLAVKTWQDKTLFDAWHNYYESWERLKGFCAVTGVEKNIAQMHPKRIRTSGDGAKIISSNDDINYTYLGRFLNASEAVTVSSDITQKAHSALRWLIERRQSYRNDTQVFITWEKTDVPVPSPMENTDELFEDENVLPSTYTGDVGQEYASRLNKALAGYKAKINEAHKIYFMGVDSATPGRLSIIYYREFEKSDFFNRLSAWHKNFQWYQNFGVDKMFIGAPSPEEIALTAYGGKGDNQTKLIKATVERLIPCILDGQVIPDDIVIACVRRVANRLSFEKDKKGTRWDWEKKLGITCAVYKGKHKARGYKMSLEEDRITRDYLYGRLLAVADQAENFVLKIARESRDTTATRLMQRFSDRPCATWKIIEEALVPYLLRLQARNPSYWVAFKELLDEIGDKFQHDDFISDKPLSGEYLLGYHQQRRWLWGHTRKDGKWILKTAEEANSENDIEEENE